MSSSGPNSRRQLDVESAEVETDEDADRVNNGSSHGDDSDIGSNSDDSDADSNSDDSDTDSNSDSSGPPPLIHRVDLYDSSSSDDDDDSSSDDNDDWLALPIPPYAQPPKPAAPAGLDALHRLAMAPEAHPPCHILLTTRDFIVAYDLYPKARRHLLILPKKRSIDYPAMLTADDAPMVRSMHRSRLPMSWE